MNTLTPTKLAIIGRIWTNGSSEIVPNTYALPKDMTFTANQSFLIGALSFKTDRNLSKPLTVKAGQNLVFFANANKRTGINPITNMDYVDADYSVSVALPVEEANEIIENSIQSAVAWKTAHPVAT